MKRLLSLIMVVLLITALVIPVYAAWPKIVDDANLLTDDEISALSQQAQSIAQEYSMDVAIVTVPSINGAYIESYADDYYDNHGYGFGDDYSGVLLLIVMDTREWAISTCGETIAALPDWAIDELFYAMSDDLSDGYYYLAFSAYLEELEQLFRDYLDEQTVDAGDYLRIALIALVVGAAVGGIAILVMRGQMNTARAQSGATSYLAAGSFRLTNRFDIYLYSNTSRTRKAQSTSSTHRSSGGRSHGGGHGRF